MTLAECILNYRQEHGLSQREFAKQCGDISHAQICNLENRSRNSKANPSIVTLKKIAGGMHITLEELLTRIDDIPISLREHDDIIYHTPQNDLEDEALYWLQKMNPEGRKFVLTFIRFLMGNGYEENSNE